MKSILVVALANGNWTLVQFLTSERSIDGHGILHGVDHGGANT
ncbi:hypothetical protein PQR57_45600 [Paraburkholderia dipogonis]|uniref:Uncharacterized protein n=1 Tax=Paraburkholderia dipogonis TaxID=1211383 RepID=A0ABW9B5I7_9BURK